MIIKYLWTIYHLRCGTFLHDPLSYSILIALQGKVENTCICNEKVEFFQHWFHSVPYGCVNYYCKNDLLRCKKKWMKKICTKLQINCERGKYIPNRFKAIQTKWSKCPSIRRLFLVPEHFSISNSQSQINTFVIKPLEIIML